MKRIITGGALLGSLCIYLSVVDFAGVLMRFLIAGELPGGFISVSANAMLLLILLTTLILLTWTTPLRLVILNSLTSRKHGLPRNRYAPIQ